MNIEYPGKDFQSNRKRVEVGPADPDLKKMVFQRQELEKRIENLQSDMSLGSSGDMYSSQDKKLLRDLTEKKEKLAGEIFEKCVESDEDYARFLSREEIIRQMEQSNQTKH